MKYIVGFSGGIDSQATARWVLNRYQNKDVILINTDPGGNEHPLTVEHIQWYSDHVHPVVRIHAIVADMWEGTDEPQKHGYAPDMPLTFDLMARIKGRFPSRRAQFCTEILKLKPVRRWLRAHIDADIERYSGVRRDESEVRRTTPFRDWDDYFDCYVNHPLADWSKQMCFDYVKAHGEQINPLYTLGFARVGCAPCINSGKDDILNWSMRFPEMIDKIRRWEQEVKRTFFAPCVPGMVINWIDDVVTWARTSHGGKQSSLLRMIDPPACESAFGLCE